MSSTITPAGGSLLAGSLAPAQSNPAQSNPAQSNPAQTPNPGQAATTPAAAQELPADDHEEIAQMVAEYHGGGMMDLSRPLPALPPSPDLHKSLPDRPGKAAPPGVAVRPNGDYRAPSSVAPHLMIDGSPEFHYDVDAALDELSKAPTGRQLLDEFGGPARKGNSTTIEQAHTRDSFTYATLNPRQTERNRDKQTGEAPGLLPGNYKATELAQKGRLELKGKRRLPFLKGEGADAVVKWNPSTSLQLNGSGQPTGLADDKSKAHLTLAHELIHARRIVKGTYTGGKGDRYDASTPAGQEEERAVGVGTAANQRRISENSIRHELKEPLRTQYGAHQEHSSEESGPVAVSGGVEHEGRS